MSEIKEYYKKQAEGIIESDAELKELKGKVGEDLSTNGSKLVLTKAKSLFDLGKTFQEVYGETGNGMSGLLGTLLIMALQKFLRDQNIGFDGEIDGIYGKKTRTSVYKFQENRNIKNTVLLIKYDGWAGKDTINAMLSNTTDPKPRDSESVESGTKPNGIELDGGSYIGPINEEGKPQGAGTLNFPNGDSYQGSFVDGYIQGSGTYFDEDGGRKVYGLRVAGSLHYTNSRGIVNQVKMEDIKKQNELPRFSSKTPDFFISDKEREALDHDGRRGRVLINLNNICTTFGIPAMLLRSSGDYDYGDIKSHLYTISQAISRLPDDIKDKMNTYDIQLMPGYQGIFSGNYTMNSILDQDGLEKNASDEDILTFDYNESPGEIKDDIVKNVYEFISSATKS